MQIGFIGQGWVGKAYADDFEARGYNIVRYSLEQPYVLNKDAIATCDIVFIAVPTPTTEQGFDPSILRHVIKLVGKGNIAVVKSTILPGTTLSLQEENPDIFVLHNPEFLVEASAAYDASHPKRNLVGTPAVNEIYQKKAELVVSVLPKALYTRILPAADAELVKYAGNCFLLTKVMFMNVLYDLVVETGGDWESVREALVHDPRIGESHTNPVHNGGRGAGGDCFVKDFEAFRRMYNEKVTNPYGQALLKALKDENLHLLVNSGKNKELLQSVYGDVSSYT